MKYSANSLFVFDIDGTVTDSVPQYLRAITRAFKVMGIKKIDTDYNNYLHHTDSYALRYNYENNFSEPFTEELLVSFEDVLSKEFLAEGKINEIQGAKGLLDTLKKQSIPYVFATGGLPKPSEIKLMDCEIAYQEKLVATSAISESREGFVKNAIAKAQDFYGIDNFTEIYSVGDGLWDYKTAQNLNLEFIGIGEKHKEIFKKSNVKYHFDHLNGLQSALKL